MRSWGGVQSKNTQVFCVDPSQPKLPSTPKRVLVYGLGRSYGDVCLNDDEALVDSEGLKKVISFDPRSGVIQAQAGVILEDVIKKCMPFNWFFNVSPGTKRVTLGGALANDVHGKNHCARGSFGHHVRSFVLLRSTGEKIYCSPHENSGLFHATIGGLGLTGMILEIEIQMRKISGPLIYKESFPFHSVTELLSQIDLVKNNSEYVVAWVDGCSIQKGSVRGILSRANHLDQPLEYSDGQFEIGLPDTLPFNLVQKSLVGIYNSLHYQREKMVSERQIKAVNFIYPLDFIHNWNNLYGRKGLLQFQCTLPRSEGKEGLNALLNILFKAQIFSPLVVIKIFGSDASPGFLSFPQEGYSLSLDFPNSGTHVDRLIDSLNECAAECGGRIYPAKDLRMTPQIFQKSFPQIEKFMSFADHKFSSNFSRRVKLN